MAANSRGSYVSPEAYLVGEDNSPVKHEYRGGQIYAMAGASNAHVLIAVNLATTLRTHLRGKGCLTFASDTKVHIQAINTYHYPDVIVTCDERDRSFSDFVRYPCLLVEVLSDTTEAFDRGDKFADYRQLESLQEYVLVS
ncbi:Uma2 family endonuclease [Trichocoleus desertorum]|uniref:Uma2 family endonuclease n=1 Tax=Trichocoleus desertorum TaxID=1481672 RepID=UPI003D65FCA5